MLTLKGGPCEGTYMVKRAPLYLRASIAPVGGTITVERKDVLDQIEDVPLPDELIYIYERVGEAGTIHLNAGSGRRGRGVTGFYAVAEYRWIEDVDGEQLRDNEAWRIWAIERAKAKEAEKGDGEGAG